MSTKISKSDKLDREQEAREKAWLATRKESQHFAVGTYVIYDGGKWMVDRYHGRVVWLTRETDEGSETVFIFNPYFIRGINPQ